MDFLTVLVYQEGMLDSVQRTDTKMISASRRLTYLEQCFALDLFTLEYQRTRIALMFVLKAIYLESTHGRDEFRICCWHGHEDNQSAC